MKSSLDDMVLVYVPEGDFLMGSSASDPHAASDQQPQHRVFLNAFWIDETNVTNAMYAECVQSGVCLLPDDIYTRVHGLYYGNPQYADYPVVSVSWNDAQTYCKWASRRLPTEAEWEKAARGTDARIYPWGNSDPTCSLANFGGFLGGCVNDTSREGDHLEGASPYGVLDMAGNVEQWVADWYSENYYSTSPTQNPTGPDTGLGRVLRGGAWVLNATGMRSANRFWLHVGSLSGSQWIGFRCALSH